MSDHWVCLCSLNTGLRLWCSCPLGLILFTSHGPLFHIWSISLVFCDSITTIHMFGVDVCSDFPHLWAVTPYDLHNGPNGVSLFWFALRTSGLRVAMNAE